MFRCYIEVARKTIKEEDFDEKIRTNTLDARSNFLLKLHCYTHFYSR